MDGGALKQSPTARQKPPTWKLAPDVAPNVQGLAVTGFPDLPEGWALLVELEDGRGGSWLRALRAIVPVTDAVPPSSGERPAADVACAVAVAGTGLKKMGLPPATLSTFSRPFQQGMFQVDRLRRLGDRRKGAWLGTVLDGGPLWSADTLPPQPTARGKAYEVPSVWEDPEVRTNTSVDALVLLYSVDEASAATLAERVASALGGAGAKVVRRLDLALDPEKIGVSREHFGFADGLSQPDPFDAGGAVTLDGAKVTAPRPVQGVPLGEFLFGYVNAHHEIAPRPAVPESAEGLPDPRAFGLVPLDEAQGFFDFGRNGSYLVARELRQDVAAFWRSMAANAERVRRDDPTATHVDAGWLAERIIGRSRDGHLLCPNGKTLPPREGIPDSDYLFLDRDARGAGCPSGSHVRRANPRDALSPSAGDAPTLLDAANHHRILRRGRKFGPKVDDPMLDDGKERGLLFLCLNTDIARQFEFVQQTWLLNSNFATLFEEVDPLLGPKGRMTVRDTGLRRSLTVETYVKMVGGDYFFLPSLPALRYLEAL